MGWCRTLLISSLLLACSQGSESSVAPPLPVAAEPPTQPAAPIAMQPGPRPQPKPGERVRQPELDGYCAEVPRPLAYYYHGGVPVTRLARKDRCTPLYLTDCETEDNCYPPRDQEPGMWCCGVPQVAEGTPTGEPAAALQQARR
jgi:hypothetical protein